MDTYDNSSVLPSLDRQSSTSEDGTAYDLAYSKEAVDFVTVAGHYCRLLEEVRQDSRAEFIIKLQRLLPFLYLKACLLPKIEDDSQQEVEHFVSELDYFQIKQEIAEQLGTYELFVDLQSPDGIEGEAEEQLSIVECLADIYQITKDFTLLYQFANPEAIKTSLYDCRLSFESYWGPRLLAASVLIHNLRYANNDEED